MIVTLNNDDVQKFINDDPVRKHIPWTERVGARRFVLALRNSVIDDVDFYKLYRSKVQAIVCVALKNSVPVTEEELLAPQESVCVPSIAVFYTLWSYKKGSGSALIFDAVDYIKRYYPGVDRFVTMSPLTDMATKFHLKNGAELLSVNETTQNFEYKV